MESGDGLLVRLNLPNGYIDTKIAQAVAALSTQYGNEQIDLTSRGNLQIRGVATENYEALFHALTALGITEQSRPPKQETAPLPELGFHNGTLTLGLVFGRVTASALTWLASIATDGKISLSTQRTMTLHNISEATLAEAQRMGFITESNDSRRFIEACPGAPACASAQGTTRDLALAIAAALPNLNHKIHVSGCAKGCACSVATSRVITARAEKYTLAMNAKAEDMPLLTSLSQASVIKVLTEWETP